MKILPVMLTLLAVVPAHAGTTMRYTVLFQGKPGGAQTTQVADDGTISVDYSYPQQRPRAGSQGRIRAGEGRYPAAIFRQGRLDDGRTDPRFVHAARQSRRVGVAIRSRHG